MPDRPPYPDAEDAVRDRDQAARFHRGMGGVRSRGEVVKVQYVSVRVRRPRTRLRRKSIEARPGRWLFWMDRLGGRTSRPLTFGLRAAVRLWYHYANSTGQEGIFNS